MELLENGLIDSHLHWSGSIVFSMRTESLAVIAARFGVNVNRPFDAAYPEQCYQTCRVVFNFFFFVLLCCPWSVYLVTRLMSRCRFSVCCRSVLRHDVTSGRHRHSTPVGATHTSTDDVTTNSTSKKYRVTWRKTPGNAQWRLARPPFIIIVKFIVSGQFFVMMSPQEVLDAQRQIAPKTGSAVTQPNTFKPCAREGRRKVLHNEGR